MEFTPENAIRSEVSLLGIGPAGNYLYRAAAWLGLDKCPVMKRLIIVSPTGEQLHNQPWDTAEVEAIRRDCSE